MQDGTPLISVITAVYNGERYLADAIRSALEQTAGLPELVVVDDGSTDGSAAVAESFGARVRVVRAPHRGQGAARNEGMRVAGGAYLAFLDADDLFATTKHALQLAAFERDPALDIVFGHVLQFVSDELRASMGSRFPQDGSILPGHLATAALGRRAAFDRIGPFCEGNRVADQFDWHLRMAESSVRTATIPDVIYHRRLHDRNLGLGDVDHRKEYVRLVKALLDRRRSPATERKP